MVVNKLNMSLFLKESYNSNQEDNIDNFFDYLSSRTKQQCSGLGRLLMKTMESKKNVLLLEGFPYELKLFDKFLD